jgi:hypothetical protein
MSVSFDCNCALETYRKQGYFAKIQASIQDGPTEHTYPDGIFPHHD